MYPGADANASGVVAMTSIAEMMSHMYKDGRSFDCNIIFVAFDAKEHNMAGSNGLWRLIDNGLLKDPVSGKRISKEHIEFMVNIDQIGSTLSPIREYRKDFIIMLGNDSLKPIKQEMINICNKFYGLNMDIGLSYYGSDNFTKLFYRLSDQKIFVDNKIPAVYFTSGITMNNNKTYDSPGTLNYAILQKRIYLIYHWIDRMI
jgi:Zn-dependent M28 family amino/carboxypeptidase